MANSEKFIQMAMRLRLGFLFKIILLFWLKVLLLKSAECGRNTAKLMDHYCENEPKFIGVYALTLLDEVDRGKICGILTRGKATMSSNKIYLKEAKSFYGGEAGVTRNIPVFECTPSTSQLRYYSTYLSSSWYMLLTEESQNPLDAISTLNIPDYEKKVAELRTKLISYLKDNTNQEKAETELRKKVEEIGWQSICEQFGDPHTSEIEPLTRTKINILGKDIYDFPVLLCTVKHLPDDTLYVGYFLDNIFFTVVIPENYSYWELDQYNMKSL